MMWWLSTRSNNKPPQSNPKLNRPIFNPYSKPTHYQVPEAKRRVGPEAGAGAGADPSVATREYELATAFPAKSAWRLFLCVLVIWLMVDCVYVWVV